MRGYLTLSLKSAEMIQSERQVLKGHVIGEKEIVDETKSAIRLVMQHAAGSTRSTVSQQLEAHQSDLERSLLVASKANFRNGPGASPRCFLRSKSGG
jgi:hypothetical protein